MDRSASRRSVFRRARLTLAAWVLAPSLALAAAPPTTAPKMAKTPFGELPVPSRAERAEAVKAGLMLIYKVALDPDNFQSFATDYLWCFYTVSVTAGDPGVRDLAHELAVRMALRYRQWYPRLADEYDAEDVGEHMMGVHVIESLGMRHPRLRADLEAAAPKIDGAAYLGYDAPKGEPMPADLPDECQVCGKYNKRGTKWCEYCDHQLDMLIPVEIICDSLIGTFFSNTFGAPFGAKYVEVLKYLPKIRDVFRERPTVKNRIIERLNAVTHLIYTLTGYGQKRLDRALVPVEYKFLREMYDRIFALDDVEMMSEVIDTLKILGHADDDPLIEAGHAFIYSRRLPDGSWRSPDEHSFYDLYHATWTGVDGLREYKDRPLALHFPETLPLLSAWAKDEAAKDAPKK